VLASAACDLEPAHAPMRFALSDETREALADRAVAQEHLRGGLEMLFGTPQQPAYMLLEEWVKEDFDPNWPSYPVGEDGSGEFEDEELDALRADNRRRFADELEALAAGRFEDVPTHSSAPDLDRRWRERLEEHGAGELSADELREEGTELFEGYYPTLVDSAELYRQQCLHCHGVEGGGNGPTAGPRDNPYLNPRPRDYRRGVFKFTALKDKARPRRDDLWRVLDEGIYTTAMPSFRRFSKAELHGLVDYVRLLAIRGEVETRLTQVVLEDEPLTPGAFAETLREVWDKWQEAQEKVVTYAGEIPEPTPELLARGRELFMDASTGNCFSCHGEQGLGDGVAAWKQSDEGELVPAYLDDWGNPIVPRNLQRGVYRFGRRPFDIYCRIYAGINGGPMPAIGESRDANGNLLLQPQDLWALVHYARSLAEQRPHVVADPARVADERQASTAGSGHGAGGAGH
jgi:mono/diheme cytochrome c family protein